METIFDALFAFIVLTALSASFFCFRAIKKIQSIVMSMEITQKCLQTAVECNQIRTEQMISDIHGAILESSESIQKLIDMHPGTQIKKNNWENIKEAFRGPSRMEIGE